MEYLFHPTFLVLSFGILQAFSEGGKCPDMPTEAMSDCAKNMQVDLSNAESYKFLTDKKYTNRMCQGKEVNKAVDCMDTIYKDCMASGKTEHDMLIKPESWRKAIKEICDNRKLLKANYQCVLDGAEEMLTCVNQTQQKALADANIKKIGQAVKQKDNQKEMHKEICGLFTKMMPCFDKTLLKNCPKKMKTVIDNVLYKFLPPVCHPGAEASYDHVNDKEKDPENGAVRLSAVATMSMAVVMCLRSMI